MYRSKDNIYKRKDGRWEGRYIKGRKPNGTIHYGYVYRRSYKEAKMALHIERMQGRYNESVNGYFSGTCYEWLQLWLWNDVRERVKPTTFRSYLHKCESYIIPEIGNVLLRQVTVQHVQELVEQWSCSFSQSTVKTLFRILNISFKTAAAQQFLPRNPCDEISIY